MEEAADPVQAEARGQFEQLVRPADNALPIRPDAVLFIEHAAAAAIERIEGMVDGPYPSRNALTSTRTANKSQILPGVHHTHARPIPISKIVSTSFNQKRTACITERRFEAQIFLGELLIED